MRTPHAPVGIGNHVIVAYPMIIRPYRCPTHGMPDKGLGCIKHTPSTATLSSWDESELSEETICAHLDSVPLDLWITALLAAARRQ